MKEYILKKIENKLLLAQLKTIPSYMAGGCVCTVWQPVMLLAHSLSFFCATLSFVQIYYSKFSYALTGAHDVKMQVGPQQMLALDFLLAEICIFFYLL